MRRILDQWRFEPMGESRFQDEDKPEPLMVDYLGPSDRGDSDGSRVVSIRWRSPMGDDLHVEITVADWLAIVGARL